jgi:hypothetical protein
MVNACPRSLSEGGVSGEWSMGKQQTTANREPAFGNSITILKFREPVFHYHNLFCPAGLSNYHFSH